MMTHEQRTAAVDAADRDLLEAIMDARDPEQLAQRIFAYYRDADRAERTSREQMCLHLGMLSGAIMRMRK